MEKESVALLIDWENIKYSTLNHLHSPPDIITLKKIARRFGTLVLARAYANWSDHYHSGDMERFSLQDIEPIYVSTRKDRGRDQKEEIIKGSVDLRLAVDCMELLFTNPEITTFVLATGDGEFSHLASKLRGYGKTVVALGVREAMGRQLGIASTRLIYYDDWIKGLNIGEEDLDVGTALVEFTRAVEDIRRLRQNNDLQAIKAYMKTRQPDFDEEKIGIPSFRHLAYLAEKSKRVRIDSTSEPARAYLMDETVTDEGVRLHPPVKWQKFISSLDTNTSYNISSLRDIIRREDIYLDEGDVNDFITNALSSGVIWPRHDQYYHKQIGGPVRATQYFVSLTHPRVQVYKAQQQD